jgi:hypothetical protein
VIENNYGTEGVYGVVNMAILPVLWRKRHRLLVRAR